MKFAKWKYRFMHNRLTEMGYKPQGIDFKRAENTIYVGLYRKGKNLIHIEDIIKNFQNFVNSHKHSKNDGS